MKTIEERFSLFLKDIIWPTKEQIEKEFWNISGILKNKSNQYFKYDVRPMFSMPNNQLGKKGTTASKADKIVFETNKNWVVIDTEELYGYIKKHNYTVIQFEHLINNLEWNIVITK